MKRALILIVAIVAVIVIPATADIPYNDTLNKENNYYYMVSDTNVPAGTVYYPSRYGLPLNNTRDFSVWRQIEGGVTMTVEHNFAWSTRIREAAIVGTATVRVDETRGLTIGDTVYIGRQQIRVIAVIQESFRTIGLTGPLTSAVGPGEEVVKVMSWSDITKSGYDTADYSYDHSAYLSDSIGSVDFDNYIGMRIRIASATTDATNSINYIIRSR